MAEAAADAFESAFGNVTAQHYGDAPSSSRRPAATTDSKTTFWRGLCLAPDWTASLNVLAFVTVLFGAFVAIHVLRLVDASNNDINDGGALNRSTTANFTAPGSGLQATLNAHTKSLSIASLCVCGAAYVAAVGFMFLATFTDPGVIARNPPGTSKDDDTIAMVKDQRRAARVAHPHSLERSLVISSVGATDTLVAPPRPSAEYVTIRGIDIPTPRCTTCNVRRPVRASHCVTCQNCVLDFDHHCSLIGACVGRHSVRYFVSFVWGVGALSWLCAVSAILVAVSVSDDTGGKMFAGSCGFAAVASIMGLQLGCNLSCHYVGLFRRGFTHREYSKQDLIYGGKAQGRSPFEVPSAAAQCAYLCCPPGGAQADLKGWAESGGSAPLAPPAMTTATTTADHAPLGSHSPGGFSLSTMSPGPADRSASPSAASPGRYGSAGDTTTRASSGLGSGSKIEFAAPAASTTTSRIVHENAAAPLLSS